MGRLQPTGLCHQLELVGRRPQFINYLFISSAGFSRAWSTALRRIAGIESHRLRQQDRLKPAEGRRKAELIKAARAPPVETGGKHRSAEDRPGSKPHTQNVYDKPDSRRAVAVEYVIPRDDGPSLTSRSRHRRVRRRAPRNSRPLMGDFPVPQSDRSRCSDRHELHRVHKCEGRSIRAG